jgi:SAM-dependent methyltransferase
MSPPSPALAASHSQPPSADAAWQSLRERSSAPYRRRGHFAWHWARGKLQHDPVFRGMLARGDWVGRARVVDIGCGQSLLASLFQACADEAAQGRWPADWPPAPKVSDYTGIELMQRDVDCARESLSDLPLATTFLCGDMCDTPLPACDAVVILDVLHYVSHAAQWALLQRVKNALLPHGRLLLRVGDQADERGFRISQWVDRVVCRLRGHRAPPTACRTLGEWQALLTSLGFKVQTVPMSQGTPFANVLLVADLA